MIKDQLYGFAQILETLLPRPALAICTGDFCAVRDKPLTIPLDNSCELVSHNHKCIAAPLLETFRCQDWPYGSGYPNPRRGIARGGLPRNLG
jgi:hypothetical protein